MPKKCEDCSSYLFCMSVAEVNEEDFETMANKRNCKKRVFTNADRIRAMSDSELAEIIACPKGLFDRMDCFDDDRHCEDCILKWLQQPVGTER